MKINKFLLGLAAVVLTGGLASCNTDVQDDTRYNNTFSNVSFETASASKTATKDESSLTIPVRITRSKSDDAISVVYKSEASAEGIFSDDMNGTIQFAVGEVEKTITVTAANLEKEQTYTNTLTLVSQDGKEFADSASLSTLRDSITNTQKLSMTITVNREGDWTEWEKWNSTGTATYIYVNYWSGEDTQEFYYRQNMINTNRYQFMSCNWGGGIDLIINYDKETGRVTVPETYTGYDHSTYGSLYVADLATYSGDAATESDYGTFDEKLGIFTIPLVYYVSAGYFGYDPEYLYIDGISRADYSSALAYAGIFTDANQNVFAVGQLAAGADVTAAKAVIMEQDADAAAVADAIAAGELEATDVVPGVIYVPMPEGLTGKLQMITVVVVDGAVMSYATVPFEYYGGGANPWKSLGIGLYTDDFFTIFNGVDPVTYEVEIEENTETPGLYRMVSPYDGKFPYNQEGDWDTSMAYNIEVNAVDPEGVFIAAQSTGVDWGAGVISIVSWGGYYLEQYEFAAVKANGYLGTLKDGVITLPVFDREGSDGSTLHYQGLTMMGGKGYYGCANGAFKLVLPSAVTASAKRAAASSRRAQDFANRLNGGVKAQKVTKYLKPVKLISGRNIR